MVVQVELWATYDFYGNNWLHNPYNPMNNTNYTAEESGLPWVHDHKGWQKINPFFSSVPALDGNNLLLEYQHAFIDCILEISFAHNHVLYSMDNETSAHPEWGKYWAGCLKMKAKEMGKKIYVTEMWYNWDPTGGSVPGINDIQFNDPHPFLGRSTPLNTINHPRVYDFIDISNNNGQSGQVHYETGLWVRNHILEKDMVRPINNVKIYGGPGGIWNGDDREGKERFWRNLFAGHAAARFHRPPSGNGISQAARYQIKCARMITEKVDFFSMVPSNHLLGDRGTNEAYCLSNDSQEYLVYFPSCGEVDLHAREGDYALHQLDLGSATWEKSGSVTLPGSIITRTDPCILVLVRKQP
jgi:hypothetical protein